MSIPGAANPLLLRTAAAGGYNVERSLRFNSSDSAYLSRTPASAGNRKTWTWAAWVKRSAFGSRQFLFTNNDSNYGLYFEFNASDQLNVGDFVTGVGWNYQLTSSSVYRDPSAWMHILFALDTAQATSSNRAKLYVNGVQLTGGQLGTATYSTQNYDGYINQAVQHNIGRLDATYPLHFSGYLADIHFIDGQALTPSSFTEVSATTGQLIPKAYTGSFGTNGFWLKFSDNSAATSTTLGKDYSGNSNNWTPNNLSVTAGAGNDSLVDTPSSYGTDTSVGGEVRGNYATLNPLLNSYPNLSNGNLDSGPWSDNGWNRNISSIVVNTGKWYFEATIGNATDGSFRNGIGIQINPASTSASKYLGDSSDSYGGLAKSAGITGYTNAGAGTSLSNALSSGSVLRCAVDVDAGKVWIGDSTAYIGGGSPASGTSPTYTFTANSNVALGVSTWGSGDVTSANYGQRAFSSTAPSGFKALCDTNLPAPVVAKPSTVMDVKLWSGNGGTQTISGWGFSPDFVWVKQRDSTNTASHVLVDIVRGNNNVLRTNGTDAENGVDIDPALYDGVTNLSTSSFDVVKGSSGTYNGTNGSGKSYVGWVWDAGSSTVTNTQGSITSTVRANPSAGFSICTYTVSASSQTFGHGLNAAPKFCIAKRRNGTSDWYSQFVLPNLNGYMLLNSTNALTSASYSSTSTTFPAAFLGGAGEEWVHYCFAPVAGYSNFGSYVGNGSSDGPFQWCGFRPRWILIKNTSTTADWCLFDTARDPYNQALGLLNPNLSNAENILGSGLDILSNGFKLRRDASPAINNSGNTFVYAAFAESPLQYARAR